MSLVSLFGGDSTAMIVAYRDQMERMERTMRAAAVATNFGAGGKDGVRYDGLFYHQWVGRYNAAVQSYESVSTLNTN